MPGHDLDSCVSLLTAINLSERKLNLNLHTNEYHNAEILISDNLIIINQVCRPNQADRSMALILLISKYKSVSASLPRIGEAPS